MNTISTRLTARPVPPITFPFLWQDEKGRVWLRNGAGRLETSRDILALGPSPVRPYEYKLGDITNTVTPDEMAWERRTPAEHVIQWRNSVSLT